MTLDDLQKDNACRLFNAVALDRLGRTTTSYHLRVFSTGSFFSATRLSRPTIGLAVLPCIIKRNGSLAAAGLYETRFHPLSRVSSNAWLFVQGKYIKPIVTDYHGLNEWLSRCGRDLSRLLPALPCQVKAA